MSLADFIPLTAADRRRSSKSAAANDLRAAQTALALHLLSGTDADLAAAIARTHAALAHLIAASQP